jgi:hypothetical protein
MVTYWQNRDVLEAALQQHDPDALALAGAICELVPPQHREVAYEGVYDKLRTAVWPPPRCACELARLAWRALPLEVR